MDIAYIPSSESSRMVYMSLFFYVLVCLDDKGSRCAEPVTSAVISEGVHGPVKS